MNIRSISAVINMSRRNESKKAAIPIFTVGCGLFAKVDESLLFISEEALFYYVLIKCTAARIDIDILHKNQS